jgi:hypothetical protein
VLQEKYGNFDRVSHDASLITEEFAEGKRAFAERRNPTWVRPEFHTNGRL